MKSAPVRQNEKDKEVLQLEFRSAAPSQKKV